MLLGRSPLRISFVGGGTDLEEYHKQYDGYSISATIDKFTFVAAKLRTDKLYQGLAPDFYTYFSTKKMSKILQTIMAMDGWVANLPAYQTPVHLIIRLPGF